MQLKFDINNKVKVKLTNKGREILEKNHIEVFSKMDLKKYPYKPEPTDENGYTKFQLWQLMNYFGYYMFNGNIELPFEIEILIDIEN